MSCLRLSTTPPNHPHNRKGGNPMIARGPTHDKHEKLVDALLSFVVRATKEEATDREVQALPQVAGVLAGLLLAP